VTAPGCCQKKQVTATIVYSSPTGCFASAAGVLLGLLVWFGAELIGAGRRLGLAERGLAGAEAVWPLAVVVACRWSQSRARIATGGGNLP
jgi:hypothetical protein